MRPPISRGRAIVTARVRHPEPGGCSSTGRTGIGPRRVRWGAGARGSVSVRRERPIGQESFGVRTRRRPSASSQATPSGSTRSLPSTGRSEGSSRHSRAASLPISRTPRLSVAWAPVAGPSVTTASSPSPGRVSAGPRVTTAPSTSGSVPTCRCRSIRPSADQSPVVPKWASRASASAAPEQAGGACTRRRTERAETGSKVVRCSCMGPGEHTARPREAGCRWAPGPGVDDPC
ncbi:Uncharacterised protein [Mycobacteroides abscessus subsp. abscessus]|nr:Uncharacterised protein [Mycobacteroides abscessus subsp. abscessus]